MKPTSKLYEVLAFAKTFLLDKGKASSNMQIKTLQERFFNDLSYRLPGKAKGDRLIGFKEWKRIVSRRKKQNPSLGKIPCVLVSTSNQKEIAVEYILANTEHKKLHVLVREELVVKSLTLKFHLFALRVSIQCMVDSRRLNLALLVREVVEWTAVLDFISNRKITEFFDFTPFEKDSNALAFFLKQQGIKVTKIPSPGPLAGHHSFMIADDVVLSSAYQLEEVQHYKNWSVSKLLKWPPEQYLRYAHCYAEQPHSPKNTIGFYSHGEWVRRKSGHAEFGFGIQENELFLLDCLKVFLKKYPHFHLLVFPHPKERLDTEFESFYASKFEGSTFQIAPLEMKSSENFFKVNIGVMAYSTLLFERLALGYKTFIGTNYPTSFPLESSPLKNLCLSNYDQFEHALLLSNEELDQDFFIRCQLEKYPLKEFLNEKVAEIQK